MIQSSSAPEDSRRLLLQLTAKGRQALDKASASVPDRLLEALAAMSPRDQRELDRLLSELLDRAAMSDMKAELFFEYDNSRKKEERHEQRG
jgi:DNA-binding MarR family transcriptional regulator